jgi:hypothetical protein
LAFAAFGVATQRRDGHSRTVGMLVLVPALVSVTNSFVLPVIVETAPPTRPELALVVTAILALTMLALGDAIRSDRVLRKDPVGPHGQVRA